MHLIVSWGYRGCHGVSRRYIGYLGPSNDKADMTEVKCSLICWLSHPIGLTSGS